MVFATYTQSTGKFALLRSVGGDLLFEASGYAGKGIGKNNPDMEHVRSVGPLPQGDYFIHRPITHPRLGPVAMRLIPGAPGSAFGRSGFYIHGDSKQHPGEASTGCIILPRHVREAVARYAPLLLQVRP